MNLDDIRKEIDETDKELFRLFERRMKLASEVAASKVQTGDSIYKPDREQEVIDRFKSGAADDMKSYYEAFIRRVILISREYQYSVISEGEEVIDDNELLISFSYKKGWPDNIISAISDLGATIMEFNKYGNTYTIRLKNDIEPDKIRALLTLIECESDK